MIKRLAMLLLCIILITTLCSCGKTKQQSDWDAEQSRLNRSIEETRKKSEQLGKDLGELSKLLNNN